MKRKKFLFFKDKSISLPSSNLITVTKRQRFVIVVFILSSLLFLSENIFGSSGFYVTVFISLFSSLLFFLSVYTDMQGNRALYIFILPVFLFTLSFGLFYFLLPDRLLFRVGLTALYAVGLYLLLLCQNIFIVSTLRTIPLLGGARVGAFFLTLLSYFFLVSVIFSLRMPLIATGVSLFIFSALASFQTITIIYEKSFKRAVLWVLLLSICLLEIGLILWFWPATPTLLAVFLTGFFYMIVGLSHVWLDKRLFKGVIWEYLWVAVLTFTILIAFTSWRG